MWSSPVFSFCLPKNYLVSFASFPIALSPAFLPAGQNGFPLTWFSRFVVDFQRGYLPLHLPAQPDLTIWRFSLVIFGADAIHCSNFRVSGW